MDGRWEGRMALAMVGFCHSFGVPALLSVFYHKVPMNLDDHGAR